MANISVSKTDALGSTPSTLAKTYRGYDIVVSPVDLDCDKYIISIFRDADHTNLVHRKRYFINSEWMAFITGMAIIDVVMRMKSDTLFQIVNYDD